MWPEGPLSREEAAHAGGEPAGGDSPAAPFSLRPGRPEDAGVAARLIYLTMRRVADYLFGRRERALRAFENLFRRADTRFSHSWATVAVVEGRVVGLLLAAPAASLDRTAWPTARALAADLGLRGMTAFVWRSLWLLGLEASDPEDCWVAHLAVLPAYQARGLGGALLRQAEAQARLHGSPRVALVVEMGDERVRAFYERRGYRVTLVRRTPRLERRFGYRGLYRMEKAVREEAPPRRRGRPAHV